MERNMMWGSLALGILGWLCTLLLARPRAVAQPPGTPGDGDGSSAFAVSRVFLGLAVLLPLVVWGATLPVHAPFSAGQGWGRGFLLGGIGSLAAFLVVSRATSRHSSHLLAVRVAATAPLFAALVVACVPLIWMRHSVIDALMGAGIGWVATTLMLLLGQNEAADSLEPDTAASAFNPGALLLANGAAFAVTLFTVAALGVYRDFVIASVARGTFSAVAVTLGGVIAVALLIRAIASKSFHVNEALGAVYQAISILIVVILPVGFAYLAALATLGDKTAIIYGTGIGLVLAILLICLGWDIVILPIGFGYLLGTKLLNDYSIILLIGAGLLLGALLLWLVQDEVTRSSESATADGATAARLAYVPIWGVLVALCGFMFAYQMMQGFGVGIMLLAAWPVSLLALPSGANQNAATVTDGATAVRALARRYHVAHSLSLLLSIVSVLLLSRLFTTRFRADLRGVGLSDQFAIFGFVIGAAFPALLASLWFSRATRRSDKPSLALPVGLPVAASPGRLGVVGLLALAVPVAMIAVWGAKVGPALFAGLALAMAGFTPVVASRRQPLTVALFSLAMGLTVAQWTHRLAPFAELSRAQRLHILLWVLGALVLLALIFDYGSRVASGLRARK